MTSSIDDQISTREAILIHNYLHLAPLVLLYYDHLITFEDEVAFLWARPKTMSTWLFFANRYLAFFGNFPVMIMDFVPISAKFSSFLLTDSVSLFRSCMDYNIYRQLLIIVNVLLIGGLMTLRIYALYELNRRLLYFLGLIAAILIGISSWAMLGQEHSTPGDLPGCHATMTSATAIRLVAAWEALFFYDSLLFILMIRRTWKSRHHIVPERLGTDDRPDISLVSLISRDGAVYFAVMALSNLSNIITFYAAPPFLKGVLSTFSSSISVTMMSRLMLNLHKWASAGILTTNRTRLDTFTNDELTLASDSSSRAPILTEP